MANIYVGNLPFQTTEDELRRAFEEYGQVSSVNVIKDRETGRPRGFAFVEMPDSKSANQAIEALNLSSLGGRNITVNEARPRDARPGGGGGGGGGGGNRGPRRQW